MGFHQNLAICAKCAFYTNFVDYMLTFFAYYAGIMLNAFATYYAQNYTGIIGSSLFMVS